MGNYSRITFKERVRIEAGIYSKKSFSQIAKEIGRSTSTVTREVKQNRIMIRPPITYRKECVYPPHCAIKGLCGDENCHKRCWTCDQVNCIQYCERFKDHTCTKTEKAPYVCEFCNEKKKKTCRYNKYYYIAEKADAKAKQVRSESREGVHLTQEEIQTLNEILYPLIRQGQPLSHICNAHKNEIKVSERSIYNYIGAGQLKVSNLDLRRKVKYKRRKKKESEIKCNRFSYRKGRTYEDYLSFMEHNPNTPVVEMDTVRGLREKEQVILTMMFSNNSVMLMFLIEDESMQQVIDVFNYLTKALGIRRFRKLFPVILTDNGRCFKDALSLEYTKSGSPRTRIFYCDPQASWQKPHIEKNHEFIRYVIPKGKSFKALTQEDVTLIANHINSTIRPGLNYASPFELVETEEMKKLLEILNMSSVTTDEVCLTPKLLRK